jgi:hypothetical protein
LKWVEHLLSRIPAETHASFLALERNNSYHFALEHKYLLGGVSISNQFSNFEIFDD